jgi:hypothetical protein
VGIPPAERKRSTKKTKGVVNTIIAIDFDGVLCKNEFPLIGEPNYKVISYVRQLIDSGAEVILWTSRCEKELQAAVDWCNDYGLHFCAVNDNAPSNKEQYKDKYKNPPRKVYADVYIDDHNGEFEYGHHTKGYETAMRGLDIVMERLVLEHRR